ncbi:MAG: hypothetical protein OXI50_10770 [Gammaproteobacteria bacterium]|nr:hypothetical protein [Gammaproteobacteria bacterium]
MTALRDWLDARRPVPPDGLKEWLAVEGEVPVSVAGLADLGIAALDRAEVARQLDRHAAFQLLAADALLTYACEAAVDEPEVTSGLHLILDRCAAAWQ